MIDLGAATRAIAGATLAVDHADPRHYHLLPPPPRVARHGDVPLLSLLRLVRDGELRGGLLTVVLELAWSSDALAAIHTALDEELGEDEYTVGAVQAVAAEAELFLARRPQDAGEPSPDQPPEAVFPEVYGVAAARTSAPHRARFSLRLSAADTRLIEAALRSGAAPIGAVYRLQLEALRPGRRVVAKIDWSRAYHHFSSHFRAGGLFYVKDVRQLVERLVEERVVEIDAVEGLDDTAAGDALAEPPAVETGPVNGADEAGDAAGQPADDGRQSADESVAQVLEWVQRSLIERFSRPVMPLSREPARASLGHGG